MSKVYEALPVNYNGEHIYDIAYSNNFDGLATFFKSYNPEGTKKLCIVSDSKVASYYMDAILDIAGPCFSKVVSYVFEEGEQSKTLDTVRGLYVKLIEEKFDRKCLLLALGGGVTGDMCGYAAATFLRGIDFIQVPTSLLADVDSSIGGKTGVDFDQYKNMVGAFHMPKLVYINLNTISTLDRRQFYSGMGEVVKSALIKNADFYNWLSDNINSIETLDEETLQSMIYKCNIVKKNVVEDDPHETKGERALLNFGHTLGHAIEKYMNFEFLHGECVSIGCIMASYISVEKGLLSKEDADNIANLIANNFNLPKLPADIDINKVVEFTHNDKKVVGTSIKFILLDRIGNAIISTDVTDDDMKAAIKQYMANWC